MLEIPVTAKVVPILLAGWMMINNTIGITSNKIIYNAPSEKYHIEKVFEEYEVYQKEGDAEMVIFIDKDGIYHFTVGRSNTVVDWIKDKQHDIAADFLDYIPKEKEKVIIKQWFDREKNSKEGIFNEIKKEHEKQIKRGNK